MRLLEELKDFIIPRFCFACSIKLNTKDKYLCKTCEATLINPSKNLMEREFERKFSDENIISDFYSNHVFLKDGALQHLIHKLKYESRLKAGHFLGEKIFNDGFKNIRTWNADLIIPIPLHKVKKAERGYNQSYYIAKGLAKKIRLPVETKALIRKKYTESQTAFDISERRNNIENAFVVKRPKKIKERSIILIDDVITTGATVREAAEALLNSGAKKVYAVSAAIAE